MQASSTATTVEAVLQELRAQQEAVDRNLANGQKSIDADKALLAQLKADIGGFERTAGDLAKARISAQQASDDAQRAWDAVKDQLDELDEDVKQEIDGKIGAADAAISKKQGDIDYLAGDLGKLLDEQALLNRDLSKKEAGFRGAVAELQQLPAKLNTAAAAIQKLKGDLKAATEAGQARKVYVLAKELQRIKVDLDTWRKPDYEQKLAGQYEEARAAMEQQRGLAQQKQQEVDAKQIALSKAKAELAMLKADRDKLIKELFVPQPEQAPAARAVGKP
jgi:chromosome segregation ATPase